MSLSEKRYAFTGIIIQEREKSASAVQQIISEFSTIIMGRMGLPNIDTGKLSIITLILHANTDEIGAFTGKLGRIDGVTVKTGISKTIEPE